MVKRKEAVNKETGEVEFYIRRPLWRERVVTPCEGESMTHQSHREDCDINRTIARYMRTGQLPPGRTDGQYADVSGLNAPLTDLAVKASEASQVVEKVKTERKKKAEAEAKRKEEEQLELIELGRKAKLEQQNAATSTE